MYTVIVFDKNGNIIGSFKTDSEPEVAENILWYETDAEPRKIAIGVDIVNNVLIFDGGIPKSRVEELEEEVAELKQTIVSLSGVLEEDPV